MFPAETDFTIVRQFLPGLYDSPDFAFTFQVLLEGSKLVNIWQLKSPDELQYFIWLLG